MGDWGGSPIRLYPAFLRARDDPTSTTTWSALGSSKHHSPRKTLFYLAIKVNYVLHPQPCPSWHIQPWQLGLSPRLRGMVPLPPVSFWKDGEGMGMFLCRDLGPGPVHLCIGKTEPWKTRAEEHRLQTVGEGRVLGAGDVLREQRVLPRPGTPGSPAHPAHPKSSLPLHGSAGFNATSGEGTGTGTAAPGRGATRCRRRSPNQPSVSAVLPPQCFGARPLPWSSALAHPTAPLRARDKAGRRARC